jgi:hypothetical protein
MRLYADFWRCTRCRELFPAHYGDATVIKVTDDDPDTSFESAEYSLCRKCSGEVLPKLGQLVHGKEAATE